MKYQILIENGRIKAASADTCLGPDAIEMEMPDDFDWSKACDYIVEDGELVCDPLPEQEPLPDPIQQRLDEQEAALVELAAMITGGGA